MNVKTQSKVFIAHGHDDEAKTAVTKFVEILGLKPTVLDEQPSKGRTIIDKFEEQADEAGFAIVLLTPDDVGSSKAIGERKPRARQNVIFELGYLLAGLGDKRVCILYKEGVELQHPSHCRCVENGLRCSYLTDIAGGPAGDPTRPDIHVTLIVSSFYKGDVTDDTKLYRCHPKKRRLVDRLDTGSQRG